MLQNGGTFRKETPRMRILMIAAMLVPILVACGGPADKRQDAVLAEVNGETITLAEFEQEAKALPPYMRPILETPNGRRQFLESLITRDLLLQEALRRGIDRKPEVHRRVGQARRSIVLEAFLREVGENAPGISDEALRKHYEENPESYEVGEQARIRQIQYKDRALAEAASKRVKKGEPFEQLMGEAESVGGKASDLGFIEKGEVDAEFEAAAFGPPPGSVVGPVRTIYGFHLIEVVDKRPAGRIPFEEAREKIASELRESAQREAFEQLVAGLRKSSRVTLREPYSGMTAPEEEVSEPGKPGSPPGKPGTGEAPSPGGR